MCVAIPAKVKSIEGPLAEVEVGGISRTISIQLTPEVRRDDYVLVHAGFAIHRIDEEEARQTLKLFEDLGALEEDPGRGNEPLPGRGTEGPGPARGDAPGEEQP